MTSRRILIADDSNTARGVLAKFFAQRDFDVCEAVDGEETIEKARKLKPDLILLDVAMPHTNGIAAASVLKQMLPNVRMVLFTMYTEGIARAFPPGELAADAVISKGDGMGQPGRVRSRLAAFHSLTQSFAFFFFIEFSEAN